MAQVKYYLVEYQLLPEVFRRVVQANEALSQGLAQTASEAARQAGLSRSAYYRYKDGVRPFFEAANDRIVTVHLTLRDKAGVLSGLLNLLAEQGADLLTVNQSIPIKGRAEVTIAMRTGELKCTIDELVEQALSIAGVLKMEILASE